MLRLVAVEAGREMSRASTWRLLAGAWAVAALFCLVAAEERQIYWVLTYTALPLGMAPLAARVVSRDRERGLAPLLAGTRLTPSAWLGAKLAALVLVLALALAGTAPSMLLVVSRSGPMAVPFSAHHLLLGFLVGLTSLGAGALAGLAARRSGTAAVTSAFLVVIAWTAIGESVREWVMMADSPAGRALALWAGHLSPVTWSHDVTDGMAHGIRVAGGLPMATLGLVVMAGVLIAAAAVVGLGLQHVDEWRPAAAPAALLAALALAWGGALAAAWSFETMEDRPADRVPSRSGSHVLDYEGLTRAGEGWPWDYRDGDVVRLHLAIRGEPGATHEVRDLSLASPHYRLEPLEGGPWTVTNAPSGPPAGTGSLHVPFRLRVLYDAPHSPLLVRVTVDGEPFLIHAGVHGGRGDVPATPAALVGLLPVAAALVAARVLPRRRAAW